MKKRLSKFLSMILIAALIVTSYTGFTGNVSAHAEDGKTPVLIATAPQSEITVYVSISDKGELVLKQKSVEVSDVDADGALTISDALYCAHEKYYEGGAEAGYAASIGQYGLGLDKLWGDTSYNFGYYHNDVSAYGADEVIADGDYINAWIYKSADWSDKYAYFNTHKAGVKKNAEKTFKLSYTGFDADWNAVTGPLKYTVIKINDDFTEISTNKKGKFKFVSNHSGSYFVSAYSEDMTIVPPTLLIFVQPEKGEVIEVKNKKYTVTKLGTVKTGKKGKVTFSKSANEGKEAPETIDYAGVTYKVKVVD
ncbi:MAG: hypothetical protein K6A45_01065 [Lachnospiraceae bacterium]|nr:hypothetical protein [Lachnospiraceae bacterium]